MKIPMRISIMLGLCLKIPISINQLPPDMEGEAPSKSVCKTSSRAANLNFVQNGFRGKLPGLEEGYVAMLMTCRNIHSGEEPFVS